MAENLKQKTVKGLVWSGVERLLSQGITFVLGLILARLVTPEDYGILAIVMVFITITGLLVDGGFAQALIRKVDSTDIDRSTVLYYNIVVSVIIDILLYILAPMMARIYDISGLTVLIRCASVLVIINSLSIVQQAILISNIDFKKQTVISTLSSIISGCIGIYMAFIGYGIWALITQVIIAALVRCLALWITVRWRPLLAFSKKSFNDLFGYSSKLMISHLISGVGNEMVQVVFAKMYSTTSLGYYNYSRKMAFFISNNISTTIQRVLYPVFSKIQDNEQHLVDSFKMTLVLTMTILVPLMFLISILSDNIVGFLLTEQWQDTAPILRVVSLTMSVWPLLLFNKNILNLKKRSDLSLIVEAINASVTLGLIISFWRFGLLSVCVILLIKEILMYCVYAFSVGRVISFCLFSQIKYLLPIFIKSILISQFVKMIIIANIESNILSIIVGSFSVALIYVVISCLTKSYDYKLAVEMLKKI